MGHLSTDARRKPSCLSRGGQEEEWGPKCTLHCQETPLNQGQVQNMARGPTPNVNF